MRKTSITADIAYHDYLVLLCRLEAGWLQHSGHLEEQDLIPLEKHRWFAGRCFDFGAQLVANCRALKTANGDAKPDPLDKCLFNPVSFSSLGPQGDIVLVLLDDLDAVQQLLADVPWKLEDVCVGFCPDISSFELTGDLSNFCELGAVPDHERNQCNEEGDREQVRERVIAQAPVTHRLQRDAPLFAFTKYKIYGLASIGHGLLVQQAIFRAMAHKIQQTRELLMDPEASPLIEPEDLNSTRCCFLDLTGHEEIGTLIFTRNYSVAAAFIAALRLLTFADVFTACSQVRRLLQQSPAHRWILELAGECAGRDPFGFESIEGNHVLQWTHSSFGISPEAFHGRDNANCRGYGPSVSTF